jgi:rod shape-determining protein MreC
LVPLPFKGPIRHIFTFFAHKPFFLSQNKYQKQIRELKQKNLRLKLALKNFNHLKEENEKLRKAFSFKAQKDITLIGAEITAFIPSSWRRVAVLNKGSGDGLSDGMFVVDESGSVLGKIQDVEENCAQLIFIDDPDFSVPVYIKEKSFGMLKGNLIGAKILYIEEPGSIEKGDKVWLKIEGLSFPISIGSIKKIRKSDSSLFCDIDVALSMRNEFFDKIFIIK